MLIKEMDAKNGVTSYYYDTAGRKIAEVSPENYDPIKVLSEMSRTEYLYDKMDQLKTVTYTYIDPLTAQWVSFVGKAYKYDENGNVIKELNALGYEAGTGSTVDEKINSGYGTEYTFDLADNNTIVLDPVSKDLGLTFSAKYDYDALGRKVSQTDGRGYVTSYIYDDEGNVLNVSVGGQTIQTNTYDLTGNLKTKTDGNGNIIAYDYNALDMIRKVTLPGDTTISSSIITYQYDLMGNLKISNNSAGPIDTYTYDNQGRELSHTQKKSDGTQAITTQISYDKTGNKRFVTDGNNVITENIYDELDRLIQSKVTVTDYNNNSTVQAITYGYDANGNQTAKTDYRGNTYTNVYDPLNKIIQKVDPFNIIIEKLEYNHNGSQIKSYDAYNKLTQFTYDKNNRLLSTVDPLNHITSQTYDNAGNISTKTDGRNKVTTYNYDGFNRLISVVNAKNETTSYTYDYNGNMLTQTDGKGNTTTFEYNVANKPIRKIDHGGRTGTLGNYTYDSAKTESYSYFADGNMAAKLDRNGVTTTYTYDVHGRMLSLTSGTINISYTYDGNGNQLTMTDGTGTTTRTYDQLNRTKSKSVPNIGTMTFLYDVTTDLPSGQTAEINTDPKGNVTTNVYDKAGRLISVTAGGSTTTYTYYNNGSKHQVLYPDGSSEEYTYYYDNQLYTLVNKKADQTVIDSYTYTYDAAHNLSSKVDSKGTTSYTYDDLERLLTVTEPSTRVTSYTYDAAGNRESQTVAYQGDSTVTNYTYNNQNRLTGSVTKLNNVTSQVIAYDYDNNGNQLTVTTTPYVNGIPGTPATVTCSYNTLNQLVTTTMPGVPETVITNTYNGEGIRVAKTVNGIMTRYLYEGNDVVLELDSLNNQIARNVWGTNLICRNVSGTMLYYMYNGHADVTALIDDSGTILATYYYDAFGNITESTGTANNPFKYAGYQYDDESGLYYLNSRMYNPVIARFMQEDTYRGEQNDPLSLNLYAYCSNNPLIYWDPTGHWQVGDSSRSAAVQAQIIRATADYNAARAKGDANGMASAHEAAERARAAQIVSNRNTSRREVSTMVQSALGSGMTQAAKADLEKTQLRFFEHKYNNTSDSVIIQKQTTFINTVNKERHDYFKKGVDIGLMQDMVDDLNKLASAYNGNTATSNQLVLQYIRKEKYKGGNWDVVAGKIDQKFVDYVSNRNPGLADFFTGNDINVKDKKGNVIDFLHLSATLNALLYDTKWDDAGVKSWAGEANIDNLSGWAGDLQTFIVDVQDKTMSSNDYKTVYNSAISSIGSSKTSFSMKDLLADTDAFNISRKLGSSSLENTLRKYYSSGYETRYTTFTMNKDKETFRQTVGNYTNVWFIYPVQKWPLLQNVDVTNNQSNAVRDAFTDFIWNKVQNEK